MDDLDQLAGLTNEADSAAAAADGPVGGAPGAEGAQAEPAGELLPNFNRDAAMLVDMAESVIVGYAPTAGKFWGGEVKARIVDPLAKVLEKYNVTNTSIPPELMLALAAGPVLFQSFKCIMEQRRVDGAKDLATADTNKAADASASTTAQGAAASAQQQAQAQQTAQARQQATGKPEGPAVAPQMGLYTR